MAEVKDKGLVSFGQLTRDRWMAYKKLGEGGFGAVYQVYDLITKEYFAMKVESASEPSQVLKMEVTVLKLLQGKMHVTQFYASGRNEKFSYVIMGLLGKNLSDVRKEAKDGKLSLSTACRLIYQCVEAVEDIHGIGFLHRDIKPSNYAFGREKLSRTVMILDFGLARKYVNSKGEMRTPRTSVGFRGTVRYASIAAHQNRELGRVDDCWSVFYMFIEFITGTLPWKKLQNTDIVGEFKQATVVPNLLEGMPEESYVIHRHLSACKYPDRPKYELIYLQLNKILKRHKVRLSDPYDWEEGQQVPVLPQKRGSIAKTSTSKINSRRKSMKSRTSRASTFLPVSWFGKPARPST